MSRIKKADDNFNDTALVDDDDLDWDRFLDSMADQSIAGRRRKRTHRTKRRMDDLQEKRWLRKQLADWDTDRFQ